MLALGIELQVVGDEKVHVMMSGQGDYSKFPKFSHREGNDLKKKEPSDF